MAEYILDTTVIMHYVIKDNYVTHAESFFDQVQDTDVLVIPKFCLVECTNVLWKHVNNFGMPVEEARALMTILRRLSLTETDVTELLPQALEIGIQHRLAAYDSIYIALALKINIPLITTDQKQARAAQAEGVILKPITDFTPES